MLQHNHSPVVQQDWHTLENPMRSLEMNSTSCCTTLERSESGEHFITSVSRPWCASLRGWLKMTVFSQLCSQCSWDSWERCAQLPIPRRTGSLGHPQCSQFRQWHTVQTWLLIIYKYLNYKYLKIYNKIICNPLPLKNTIKSIQGNASFKCIIISTC